MDDINYRRPECGGKRFKSNIEPAITVRECEGCKAIYASIDPVLLPFAFYNSAGPNVSKN